MSEDSDDDKQHDPSARRLEEARKRGEVPRSMDLMAAAAYAGLALTSLIAGQELLHRAGGVAMVLIDQPDRLAELMLDGAHAPLGGMVMALGVALLPLFLLPMVAVILALLGQRAIVFAPQKLEPKLSRISPFATAKQKFGREGLFEFVKSLVKLLAVGLILALYLIHRAPDLLLGLHLSPAQIAGLMLRFLVEFLFLITLLTLITGAADYLWQRQQHIRRNRMSRKEVMEEMKDAEGDPHVKMHRRQRGQEIATNQMLQDVGTADVVLVNPTHYAVALRWKRTDRHAPVCVAKGVDEIAARIRQRAATAGVPIHSDPPTTRALYASVEIGAQILPEHYRPVAAAIRFAEALRKKGRRK